MYLHNIAPRLGILEKKGDASKRIKHLHKKKDYIDTLAEKAYLRNPDEFAFGMIKSKIGKDGKVSLGTVKRDNPHSIKQKPDYDAKRAVRNENGVHVFKKFERRK